MRVDLKGKISIYKNGRESYAKKATVILHKKRQETQCVLKRNITIGRNERPTNTNSFLGHPAAQPAERLPSV